MAVKQYSVKSGRGRKMSLGYNSRTFLDSTTWDAWSQVGFRDFNPNSPLWLHHIKAFWDEVPGRWSRYVKSTLNYDVVVKVCLSFMHLAITKMCFKFIQHLSQMYFLDFMRSSLDQMVYHSHLHSTFWLYFMLKQCYVWFFNITDRLVPPKTK